MGARPAEGAAAHCKDCDGQRLNRIALNVRFRDRSIAQLTALAVTGLQAFLEGLALDKRETEIARDVCA